MNGVLFFNPFAAKTFRMPNSMLQVAASLGSSRDFDFVDGNVETDPLATCRELLGSGRFTYFAATVMPGPQLQQAAPITRAIKSAFPQITTIWGGYFPSNQPDAVMRSDYVDYVLTGPADHSFPALLERLETSAPLDDVAGLVWRTPGGVRRNPKPGIPDQDSLNPLPYDRLAARYPIARFLPRTFLGKRTLGMHTSMGCPFTCSFCAVVPIFEGRWKGRNADLIADDVLRMRDRHQVDAIEFHDNNFFVSEARVRAFAERMVGQNLTWWGEGRIDTIDKYSDDTLVLMRKAGCKMIFFGAETGDDATLAQIRKGGKQSGEQILRFAARLRQFDIIPEYSFVLGFPKPTEEEVWDQIHRDIAFIKQVKEVNPDTEIIIYVYSPVPAEGSELAKQIEAAGFRFPETLEDWLSPDWESFDLHRNPLTPWLTPAMVKHIHAFETVLQARYPTRSSFHIGRIGRSVLSALAAPRYRLDWFRSPKELRLVQRALNYVSPETTGFYAEQH